MRPLAESERIGELIEMLDKLDKRLDTEEIDSIIITTETDEWTFFENDKGKRKIIRERIRMLDFDDIRIIRAALEAALNGDGE